MATQIKYVELREAANKITLLAKRVQARTCKPRPLQNTREIEERYLLQRSTYHMHCVMYWNTVKLKKEGKHRHPLETR